MTPPPPPNPHAKSFMLSSRHPTALYFHFWVVWRKSSWKGGNCKGQNVCNKTRDIMLVSMPVIWPKTFCTLRLETFLLLHNEAEVGRTIFTRRLRLWSTASIGWIIYYLSKKVQIIAPYSQQQFPQQNPTSSWLTRRQDQIVTPITELEYLNNLWGLGTY